MQLMTDDEAIQWRYQGLRFSRFYWTFCANQSALFHLKRKACIIWGIIYCEWFVWLLLSFLCVVFVVVVFLFDVVLFCLLFFFKSRNGESWTVCRGRVRFSLPRQILIAVSSSVVGLTLQSGPHCRVLRSQIFSTVELVPHCSQRLIAA